MNKIMSLLLFGLSFSSLANTQVNFEYNKLSQLNSDSMTPSSFACLKRIYDDRGEISYDNITSLKDSSITEDQIIVLPSVVESLEACKADAINILNTEKLRPGGLPGEVMTSPSQVIIHFVDFDNESVTELQF